MTIACKNYDFIVVVKFLSALYGGMRLSEIPREKLQRVINKTLEVRDESKNQRRTSFLQD